MPKAGHGRGSANAVSKQPRSSSTGRVQKCKQTNAVSSAIAGGRVPAQGIDTKYLHPDYVPAVPAPRSPVMTRASTSAQLQRQNTASSGISSSANIPTSNLFQMLSDEESNNNNTDGSGTDDDDDDGRARKKVLPSNKNNSPKERRPPPIFVLDTLADDIDELLEGLEYCLKIGKSSVQVITLNKRNFEEVVKELKLNNFKFYTFDPAEKTPVKIVLQGYKDRPIADLKQNLTDAGINPREIKVLSRKTTVTGTHTLYLLYFDRGTAKIQDLRRTKALDGFWVTWRYYSKNPSDAAQCHRCQKFGHGSRNCNLQPRCVKCGEKHLSEKCALPRKANLGDNAEQTKPRIKCANCGGNHTSNYRGCSARKSYLEEQEKRKKPAVSHPPHRSTSATVPAAGQRTVPVDNSASPPGWGRSFASVVAAGNGNAAQQEVTGDDLFTLPEFFALAGEMMTRFRTCRNKAEQFLALGELMIKHIYKG